MRTYFYNVATDEVLKLHMGKFVHKKTFKNSKMAIFYLGKISTGSISLIENLFSGIAITAILLFILGGLTSNADAAPKLRYHVNFTASNDRLVDYDVPSRMAACEAWVSEWNAIWTNPRLKPNWDRDGKWGTGPFTGIECYFTSGWGDPDERSPGGAYCGETYFSGSTFWVDKSTETCICYDGYQEMPDTGTCVKVSSVDPGPTPSKPTNNGPNCPRCKVGDPIDPATGNMWFVERDYASAAPISGLNVVRTYNSTPYNWDAAESRSFGVRWTQPYDAVLKPENAFIPGKLAPACWKREDTGFVWCEAPKLLASSTPAAVSILRGDGKKYLFNRSGNVWTGDADTNDRLTAVYDSANKPTRWTYISANGDTTEHYDADGLLLDIVGRNGATQTLTYSDGSSWYTSEGRYPSSAPGCRVQSSASSPKKGRLLCVHDEDGNELTFEYSWDRLKAIVAPDGGLYQYEYSDPAGECLPSAAEVPACVNVNLTKVTYPDDSSRTYIYNEAAQINGGAPCAGAAAGAFGNLPHALTGLIDENGKRHSSWTYDCSGRATSSELADGVNKVTLDYSALGSGNAAQVTHYLGTADAPKTTTVSYNRTLVLGVAKTASMSAPCVECDSVAARTYDANGNVASAKDWNNVFTCYEYDLTRNLEKRRIEGVTTSCTSALTATTLAAPMRATSTQWHSTYRLPMVIAEPKKRTTYTYDTSGNLKSVSEQSTSDETGGLAFNATLTGVARQRTITPNALGQPLTVKGPRTDINDTTTYTYGPYDSNLATITNAAGQLTKLENYDDNGRVGKITSPNGTVTELTYYPRGWLETRKVTADGIAELTHYDYYPTGLLKLVTLPDGSSIGYTYDDAHRLNSVSDSLGNSVTYTLDLRGNRIKEQVNDPKGVLARQTSRIYDTLNNMKQQTGAIQ